MRAAQNYGPQNLLESVNTANTRVMTLQEQSDDALPAYPPPSTAKAMILVVALSLLYKTLQQEPTNIMAIVVNGRDTRSTGPNAIASSEKLNSTYLREAKKQR